MAHASIRLAARSRPASAIQFSLTIIMRSPGRIQAIEEPQQFARRRGPVRDSSMSRCLRQAPGDRAWFRQTDPSRDGFAGGGPREFQRHQSLPPDFQSRPPKMPARSMSADEAWAPYSSFLELVNRYQDNVIEGGRPPGYSPAVRNSHCVQNSVYNAFSGVYRSIVPNKNL